MIERRTDHITRKRVSEMSPEDMRRALLVSEKTGLPNRRAFDEGKAVPWVAMADVNGLKALNDHHGYAAGDVLIQRIAHVLLEVKLDAYHNQGDEFLCKGESFQELNKKLLTAQEILRNQPFAVRSINDLIAEIKGASFCYGIGTNLAEAEKSLKSQKEIRRQLENDKV